MQSLYSLIDATVVLSNDKLETDITSSVLEFVTFENLHRPWVDARIVFLDDYGLRDAMSMRGSERFRIRIGDPSDLTKPVIEKNFFVYKINDTERINERSEVLSISLVEEHRYIDAIKQISKSYNDTLDNIIKEIMNVELFKDVQKVSFDSIVQGIRKVVIPYMSPLDAIQWIKRRATTKTGGPLYVYGTLYANFVAMSDFDTLMKADPINVKLPLRYSSGTQAIPDTENVSRGLYNVTSYTDLPQDNMLQMYRDGNIGSAYTNIDAGTGISSGSHVSIRDVLDEFYSDNILNPQIVQSVFDPNLLIDGKLSDEYNSQSVFQVTSSKTYNQYQSYHDEALLLDDNDNVIESKLKVKNKIIRSMLMKNVIDISMEGTLFMMKQVACGQKVRLLFLNSSVNKNTDNALDQIDKHRSGDFLITAISHNFAQDKTHNISARLTKIGDLPKDAELQ